MKHYMHSIDEVLKNTESNENGLTEQQAQDRLNSNGKNKLAESEKESLVHRFLKQLADPMIIILIVAAAVSGILAVIGQEEGGFTDVIIIGAVVLINAVLGVYQESKAEKAIEALAEMTAATSKVIRDGKFIQIKSEDLVVGDIMVLEAGDAVPADGRIIECATMKIEESALTGESVPVNKKTDSLPPKENDDIPLGDRKNMVYMGSSVVYGRGKAVVTATGMQTEMGKIADALANAKEGKTPLQMKLSELSKVLTYLVIGISIFIFLFGMLTTDNFFSEVKNGNLNVIIDTFMVAVSLAVAAIPEGLATVVTIVLSMGVTKMSKRNAVIRQLTAVETLGCTQIICSDKTGTLTQNKMTVVKTSTENEKLLGISMALCSDAELNEDGSATGEPTECALVEYANKIGEPKNNLKLSSSRICEAPFDSMRKMMSTVHKTQSGIIQYTKGAPDEILKRCTKYLAADKIIEMTDEMRQKISAANVEMADSALRVLAAAYKIHDSEPADISPEALECNMVYIGICGMIDPVRPEVKDAIVQCRNAGIRPIMITGDHIITAVAIAKELGIISDRSQAISGSELNNIPDEEFVKIVDQYSVYARVQPEHKVKIVNAWRARGCITAMTGDGVNDAPSIKNADIGIGMGITGTDVTKNVADMVLADDNFATIVTAVEEGRRIYDNIRKSIQFLLSSNLSEVVSIFIATIFGFVLLKPIHLLWINLITDTFPALALGTEKAEGDVMKRKPRDPKTGIFSGGLGVDVVYQGVLVSILTLAAYFIGHYLESGKWEICNSPDGMTMAFLTMSMAEIFHSINMRSTRSSIFKMKTHNFILLGAMLASLVLTTAVIYIPGISDAFGFEHISFVEYAIAIALALIMIPIVEIVKFFQRRAEKKNQ